MSEIKIKLKFNEAEICPVAALLLYRSFVQEECVEGYYHTGFHRFHITQSLDSKDHYIVNIVKQYQ